MIINRVWSMPSKWTFEMPVVMALVRTYVGDGVGWADPFAGKSNICEFRNDLNPENGQPCQVEAVQFLEQLLVPQDGEINATLLNGVLFDPPYSLTQVSRSYSDMGLQFKGKENPTGGFPKAKDAIAALIKPGGHCISFGWNTIGMGIKRGFEIKEILIISHGGNRNDTLCTVEVKL